MGSWIPTLFDYDSHLLEKLKVIKVTDEFGNKKPIHVTFFAPEPEGTEDRNTMRPAVVVYMYDQVHDTRREQSILSQYVKDTPTDITLKEVPTPMKFFYQFTVITDYQQHMNEIIHQLNLLFPTRGYITLTAPNGEKVSYDFFQRSVDNAYTQQFLQYGANTADRIFRKIYRYQLIAEVDEFQEYTYKKVQGVNPSAKQIP